MLKKLARKNPDKHLVLSILKTNSYLSLVAEMLKRVWKRLATQSQERAGQPIGGAEPSRMKEEKYPDRVIVTAEY